MRKYIYVINRLKEIRQELWVSFHNAQKWEVQKEVAYSIDDIIETLRNEGFGENKEIEDGGEYK